MTREEIIEKGKEVIRIEAESVANLIEKVGEDFAEAVVARSPRTPVWVANLLICRCPDNKTPSEESRILSRRKTTLSLRLATPAVGRR